MFHSYLNMGLSILDNICLILNYGEQLVFVAAHYPDMKQSYDNILRPSVS